MQNVDWLPELARIIGIVVACGTLFKLMTANTIKRLDLIDQYILQKRNITDCLQMTDACPVKVKFDSYSNTLENIQSQLQSLRKELRQEVRDLRQSIDNHTDYHIKNQNGHK